MLGKNLRLKEVYVNADAKRKSGKHAVSTDKNTRIAFDVLSNSS
jgi:hypothetical protein